MKRRIHLIKKNSFPAHSFFDHLLRGTEHYRNKKFELAAEEWGAAEWLNYDTPVNLRRQDGRIFCGGFLQEVPFLFFLYAVYASKANGIGAIKTNGVCKNLVFNEGRLIRAATTVRKERIGNFIVNRQRLSPATLDMLVADAKKQGKRIGRFLVEKGVLSRDALQELLLLQNDQILIDILQWQHGYFYFVERPIASEFIVNYGPLNLARAATYTGFSFSQFRDRIPSMKTIFRPAPYAKLNSEKVLQKLPDKHKFIFSLIDGTRNIEQIARFAGISEPSALQILYHLNAAGMIRQTLEIIEYEDRQFNEITKLLDTLLEIYGFLSQLLIRELGTKAKDVIGRSKKDLAHNYDGMFAGIPWENPDRVTREMILGNIARYCPDPKRRGLFIEAFGDLFDNFRLETHKYLGSQLARETTVKIRDEIKNVLRYAAQTPLRGQLRDRFE
jgi:hypothetical protein